MDIYEDIKRVTHIPYVETDVKFYRRKQPRIRPMPKRQPRNAELMEESPQRYYSQEECMVDEEPRTINPIEIAASIRMAAGTISCTSEEVEEYWRARQNSNTEKECVLSENDSALTKISKHKDIDFTVPRLGTETSVIPLEYLIYGIDDDSFNFVQKKPSRDKK